METLLDADATHLWDTDRWTVLADPEGNELCLFPPDRVRPEPDGERSGGRPQPSG